MKQLRSFMQVLRSGRGAMLVAITAILCLAITLCGCQAIGQRLAEALSEPVLADNATGIRHYEIPTVVTNGVERIQGQEYIYHAIVDFVGHTAIVVQNSTVEQHAGLIAVATLWHAATQEETAALLAYLATLPPDVPPKSLHIAALKSVAIVDGSPRATVVRKYLGVNYETTNCRVSQVAYDYYVAGKIKVYNPSYGLGAPENKDCFVLVYFISETPYDNQVEIPVVMDKIIK